MTDPPYPIYRELIEANRSAADRLRTLLATPTDAPLYEHVAMLREDLQHVLNLLTGAGDAR